MKRLNLLKTFLDLFLFFGGMSLLGLITIGAFNLFDNAPIPLKIKGRPIVLNDLATSILFLVLLISALLFFYAIYLFRENVLFFIRHEIFHERVIVNFRRIGIYLITSQLLAGIALFVFNIIQKNEVGAEVDIGGFDGIFLSIALGLFFIVLAEVFSIAKNLKEENELTI